MVYNPKEDSYLLSKAIKKNVKNINIKVLDMGSGSGIQAQTIIDLKIKPENIVLVDINKDAINILKKKFTKSKVIKSDLFSNIKGKFDLIVFNPPYLPQHKHDKEKDTTGGKKGSETINKFLTKAHKYLNSNGKILLLTSNLTKGINFGSYKKKLLDTKKLFFEKLYVYEIWMNKQKK